MNLNVSTMISRVVEERNDLGFKCHPVLLPDLGILKEFSQKKMSMVLLSSIGLSKSLIASYPYFTSPALMVYVEFRWMR